MSDGIIWLCEHKGVCVTPLYTGRCSEECLKRYESEVAGNE